jgi:ribonuclease R
VIHRLLKRLRAGSFNAAFTKKIIPSIDSVGKHCSDTERVAEAAERQAIRVKQVSFMKDRVGDEFSGVISGVTPYGFFVRLDNLGVEGMVRLSTIDDDYYQYDEKNFRVIGRAKKRIFRLGDPIRVGILKVDVVRAEIDLFLPDSLRKERKAAPKNGKQSKARVRPGPMPKGRRKR